VPFGRELFISASIGVSLYPEDGDNANTLLQHADAAMYQAKEKGKRNYQFFTAEMNTAAAEHLALENRLRKAVALGEFQLYYQPIIELSSGAVVSAEALIRWADPELGLLSPDKFIPLAEETGLIVPMGEWILQTACAQACLWNQNNPHPPRIAINLSARQLQQANFLEHVLDTVQTTPLLPQCLELEFKESTLMEDIEVHLVTLHALKKLGCQLSLDDFGTGYSSLAYLKRLPVDAVKIDRSFVQDIGIDPDDTAISMAVTSMAHSLKRKVIAEGVETQAQLEFLENIGVNEVQGYFIGPPSPAEDLSRINSF
jgi:EAL domain-containing protein (putative c-di-GMP-specific phosphodiesterase class I)